MSQDRDKGFVDVEATRAALARVAKLLCTPIDFDALIDDGVLDMSRLPEAARLRVYEVRQVVRKGQRRTHLKIEKASKAAAKLYRKLTGEAPEATS